jgi:hypothetical protein
MTISGVYYPTRVVHDIYIALIGTKQYLITEYTEDGTRMFIIEAKK